MDEKVVIISPEICKKKWKFYLPNEYIVLVLDRNSISELVWIHIAFIVLVSSKAFTYSINYLALRFWHWPINMLSPYFLTMCLRSRNNSGVVRDILNVL